MAHWLRRVSHEMYIESGCDSVLSIEASDGSLVSVLYEMTLH